ncbi:MAG: methyltransferase domain-containing protein [Firmicutes bacterium]|nr:methyltransferase domain-containing protein [Bacillota bacterium]
MSPTGNEYKIKSKRNFDKKAANYFNTWDGKYSLHMYGEVIKTINTRPFKSILDVGCGPGAMLDRILNHHAEVQACGIDFSEKMIEKAAELLAGKSELVTGDADNLPWADKSFDVIVCNSSFHHYPEPQKVLWEMKRVLKTNGRLIIADPWWPVIYRFLINLYLRTPMNLEGDFRIYSEKEIMEMFAECGFKDIKTDNPIGKYYIVTATADN